MGESTEHKINQLGLWRVEAESRPKLGRVEPQSRHGRESTRSHSAPDDCGESVEAHSRGQFFVGLDTGERDGKTVACWRDALGETLFQEYADPIEAVSDARFPPGATIVFEESVYGHRLSQRIPFDALMRKRGLIPYPVNPSITSGRRRCWFPDAHKTKRNQNDRLDAEVLLRIGEEGIVEHCRRKWARTLRKTGDRTVGSDRAPRLEHEVALINLRRHGIDHPSTPDAIRNALAILRMQRVPDQAKDSRLGVAKPNGNKGAWRWVDDDEDKAYRLHTFVAIAVAAESRRNAKHLMGVRGIAHASLHFHPLKNLDRQDRKDAMKLQDRFRKWLWVGLKYGVWEWPKTQAGKLSAA